MKKYFTLLAIIGSFAASAQVGIGTTDPKGLLHVVNGNVVFSATGNVSPTPGNPPISGEGRRMMWYADKAAFRAGYVGSYGKIDWDKEYIGNYSFAAGYNCRASGENSVVFGKDNVATGNSSIALGELSFAAGERSFAFNGSTTADGLRAIAMGQYARATNEDAIALRTSCEASGLTSMALGTGSKAQGFGAVAIGVTNQAVGPFSMALGRNAQSDHQGSCVFSDGSDFPVSFLVSSADYEMTMRYAGGYRLFTSTNLSSGVTLAAGGGSWASVSDFRKKENFQAIDKEVILKKLAAIPVSNWNYKTQEASNRHIGPMAQDFYAAFQLGGVGNDTTINTIDIDGVNMVAIQALEERTVELQKENAQLRSQLEAVNERLAALEGLLNHK